MTSFERLYNFLESPQSMREIEACKSLNVLPGLQDREIQTTYKLEHDIERFTLVRVTDKPHVTKHLCVNCFERPALKYGKCGTCTKGCIMMPINIEGLLKLPNTKKRVIGEIYYTGSIHSGYSKVKVGKYSKTYLLCWKPDCTRHVRRKRDLCGPCNLLSHGVKCPECIRLFPDQKTLRIHYLKTHECTKCTKIFKRREKLKRHMNTHTKPYKCSDENCDNRYATRSSMRSHYANNHTSEAGMRRKIQETKIAKALDKAGFKRLVDADSEVLPPVGWYRREFRVDYKCVDNNSNNKWHSVDFLIGVPSGIVVLEVDEHQHKFGYHASLSCDMRRMNRIMASWTIGNAVMPKILWIRYNPHAVKLDGKTVYGLKKMSREVLLVKRIARGVSQQLSIEYFFYDTNADGVPLVVQKPEYHQMYRDVATNGTPTLRIAV